MRENNEDWETHLKAVKQELVGLVRLFRDKTSGLILLSKLEGLTAEDCKEFMLYRKTVFKCIDLFSEMIDDE